MASPHVSLKRGKVGNAAAHAAYVRGEGRYSDRDDVRAVIDGNLPAWACDDAYKFFAAADANERKNGRAYIEVEAAIPREAVDPVAWAREFTRSLLGDRFAYRLAVHDRKASDGGRNVHLHLMFSDRPTDGGHFDAKRFFKRNGSTKDRSWNKRDKVHEVRWLFAKHVREVAPGWEPTAPAKPEPKIGPVLPGAGWRYEETRQARLCQVEAIRAQRRIEQAAELGRAEQAQPPGLIDLSTNLRAALAERDTKEPSHEQHRAEFLEIDPGILAVRRGPTATANGLRRLSECRLAGTARPEVRYADPHDARLLSSNARDHRRGSNRVHDARLTAVVEGVGREMEQAAQLSTVRLNQFEAGLADMLRSVDLDSETRARAEHLRQAAEDERKRRDAEAMRDLRNPSEADPQLEHRLNTLLMVTVTPAPAALVPTPTSKRPKP